VAPKPQSDLIDLTTPTFDPKDPFYIAAINIRRKILEITITTSLIQFFLCAINHPELSNYIKAIQESKHLVTSMPITIISLFYLQNIVPSQLFKKLAEGTLPVSCKP